MPGIKTENLKIVKFFLNFIVIVAIFFIGVSCDSTAQENKQTYQEGVFIIKFTDQSPLGEKADELFSKDEPFASLVGDTYLDTLNEKYQVTSYKKLFTVKLDDQKLREKFPERARRAPQGAERPNLEYIYRVEYTDIKTDAKVICERFAQSPEVEYAEPEYITFTSERVDAN